MIKDAIQPADNSRRLTRTSQRTRARIVEAVVDMVADKGISGTTLANVASAAGVSQGILVFHFKSKEGLLTETLSRLFDEYREAWQAASATGEPLERIIGLVNTDFSAAICTRKKLAMWFAFWGEAGAKPLYNKICADAEQERNQAMIDACSALPGVQNAAQLAQSIDAHTDGLWLQMHLWGRDFSREQALENARSHLRLLLPEFAGRI